MSLSYRAGPLFLVAATERHSEYANTTTTNSKDGGVKIGAGYTIAEHHTLGVMWEMLTYRGNLAATGLPKTFTAGTATEAKLGTYFISYKGDFDRHNIRVSYGQNRELKLDSGTAPDTKASFRAIGYGYEFSKRIEATIF
jgi:hypothetical protein